MITVRQLRYFQALAETRHFGRAARLLNVSQPALSAQIAAMEETVGSRLFERRPTGVVATGEGHAILDRVNAILVEIRELESFGSTKGETLTGRLRLGLIATVAPYLLPRLLPRLSLDHAALDLSIRESLTGPLLADVVAGDLDCALIALPAAEPGLAWIELGADPFWLAVPAKEAQRFRGAVEVQQLHGERLILLEEGHCLREQALKVCQLVELDRFADLSATSLTTILRMVAGGLGATLIPEIAIETERRAGGIEVLPFRDPAPSRTLALAFRRSSTRRQDFEALADIIRTCLPTNPSDPSSEAEEMQGEKKPQENCRDNADHEGRHPVADAVGPEMDRRMGETRQREDPGDGDGDPTRSVRDVEREADRVEENRQLELVGEVARGGGARVGLLVADAERGRVSTVADCGPTPRQEDAVDRERQERLHDHGPEDGDVADHRTRS